MNDLALKDYLESFPRTYFPASPSTVARIARTYGSIYPPDSFRADPIFSLYRGYLKTQADAQDEDLENLAYLCFRFQKCPEIDRLNRLIQEANIIDEKHRLDFPVYFFMQEFKFKMYIADKTEQPSLFVGSLPHHGGQMEVWAHWTKSEEDSEAEQNNTAVKTVLYNTPNIKNSEDRKELVCGIQPDWRKFIQWDEPLEQLFQLSKLTNRSLRSTVQVQNAILLSVAKVVIRYPGLMKLTTEQESNPYYVKATRIPVDLNENCVSSVCKTQVPKSL
ncbi:hypothetical protein KCU65_g8532, partial [Aureobasidium melanogenum]